MRLIENGQNFGENQVKNKKYLQKQKLLCIGLKRFSGLFYNQILTHTFT
jgi:hypothetical protein